MSSDEFFRVLPSVISGVAVLVAAVGFFWRKLSPSNGGIDEMNKVLNATETLRRHVTESLNVRLDAIDTSVKALHCLDSKNCQLHADAIEELRDNDSQHTRALTALRNDITARFDAIDQRLTNESTNARNTRRNSLRDRETT